MGQHAQETIMKLIQLMERLDAVDPSTISEEILRTLLKIVGGTAGWIAWLKDKDAGSFRVMAAVGLPEALEAEGRAHLRWSPCRCQRMLLAGWPTEAIHIIHCERLEALGISMDHLTIPLRFQGRSYGLMNLLISPDLQLEEQTRWVLTMIGRLGGAIIGHQWALDRLRMERDRLALLSRIARLANEPLPLEELLSRITQEMVTLLQGDRGAIALMAESGDHLRMVAEYNPIGTPSGLGVTIPVRGNPSMEWILRERRPLAIADVTEDLILGPVQPVLQALGIRSLLIVPLLVGDRLIGTLGIDSVRRPRVFTAEEMQLAETVAAQVAGAVERARLLERTQRQAQELAALNQALSEALRLREKMIQNVSHELRTPLAVAMGYMELLADGMLGPLSPEQQEAVTISRERLHELHRYVELLLTLQTVRAGEMARVPLDLKRLLAEVLRRWQARMDPTRYVLEARLPPEEVWLLGDPEGLIRAIGEVMDNAIKFSPGGGKIEVVLTKHEGQVMLQIQDEGIGIPKECLDRIGEPFYQVDGGTTRRFQGMGIGFAVARAIVEAHGGKLLVRPRAPRGTEVIFILPLASLY